MQVNKTVLSMSLCSYVFYILYECNVCVYNFYNSLDVDVWNYAVAYECLTTRKNSSFIVSSISERVILRRKLNELTLSSRKMQCALILLEMVAVLQKSTKTFSVIASSTRILV
jgi:hypothetical protein